MGCSCRRLQSSQVALCGAHPSVYIVTRNSRSQDLLRPALDDQLVGFQRFKISRASCSFIHLWKDIVLFLRQHGIRAHLKKEEMCRSRPLPTSLSLHRICERMRWVRQSLTLHPTSQAGRWCESVSLTVFFLERKTPMLVCRVCELL